MTRAILLFVLLLGGCAPGARDLALSELNLRDMQQIQAIRQQLGPQDGRAFADYVTRHHVTSANYCGRPLMDAHGKAPETVGEAIDLAMRRDALELQALLASTAPKHPRQLAREAWDSLIRDRDIKVDARAQLHALFGEQASRRPEWASLDAQLAEIDQKLVAMKPAVFGPGS